LGDFACHRSLVSTDGGDVTKATKHEGCAPRIFAFVASATNVNTTNFATAQISDILQSRKNRIAIFPMATRPSSLSNRITLRIDREMGRVPKTAAAARTMGIPALRIGQERRQEMLEMIGINAALTTGENCVVTACDRVDRIKGWI
jgi:hypothetical protein